MFYYYLASMAKLVIILVILSGAIAGVYGWKSINKKVSEMPVETASATPKTDRKDKILTRNGIEYGVEEYKISNQQQVKLVNNLIEKAETTQLVKDKGCTAGINGGFYDEAGNALGLLVIDGAIMSVSKTSSLLNGFVWKTAGGGYGIGRNEPQEDITWAVQAGPLLIEEARVLELNMARDKPARRMAAGIERGGELVIMTIFDSKSVYDGPRLEELPSLIWEAAEKFGWELESAINLDGGTASAFYSPKMRLEEFSTVGNFLCVY
nr:MAG: hypothetical protein A2V48_03860 [Candidatus Amesbacteria bacterium RBG_19FT_COMBO_48_16]